MNIQNNISLQDLTTFRLGGPCTDFCNITNEKQLPSLIKWSKSSKKKVLVLGGGSNLIISDQLFDGLVIKIEIQGIQLIKTLPDHVLIRVGAGVIWDEFVKDTVKNGYWGAENMSLIPGTIGAIPVQNVGAYGQDASSIVEAVNVYDRIDEEFKVLTKEDCRFSWRHSIFNTTDKERYVITTVDFKLSTKPSPNINRLDLQGKYNELSAGKNVTENDKALQQLLIRESVIALRTSGLNLPLSGTDFNAGTFFQASLIKKNKIYTVFFKFLFNIGLKAALKVLIFRTKFPIGSNFKLPANLLIDSAGCKNITSKKKNFKLFKNNSTVLIHNGKGTEEEFIEFLKLVCECVHNKTGIHLRIEPEFIGIEKSNIL